MRKSWLKRILVSLGLFALILILVPWFWLTRGEGRYYFFLPYASKIALQLHALDRAESYATELFTAAEQKARDWNYGNAIHESHIVLGRVALARGDIDRSKSHLIEAGKTPGSPQLDTFGPNMSLAKALLQKGETDVVLNYLDLCSVFWEMDRGKLDKWKSRIKNGEVPDFGGNLLY